jgi:hypothetical protein
MSALQERESALMSLQADGDLRLPTAEGPHPIRP